jgi:hypothetical protein
MAIRIVAKIGTEDRYRVLPFASSLPAAARHLVPATWYRATWYRVLRFDVFALRWYFEPIRVAFIAARSSVTLESRDQSTHPRNREVQ